MLALAAVEFVYNHLALQHVLFKKAAARQSLKGLVRGNSDQIERTLQALRDRQSVPVLSVDLTA